MQLSVNGPTPQHLRNTFWHEWRHWADQGAVLVAEDLFERAKRAEDALRDLVALEDTRLRLRSLHECGHGTDYEHYHKGLPKAWDTARAVLLGPNV